MTQIRLGWGRTRIAHDRMDDLDDFARPYFPFFIWDKYKQYIPNRAFFNFLEMEDLNLQAPEIRYILPKSGYSLYRLVISYFV